MSLKYLYGSIAVIVIAILFMVPLSKSDSKSKETVNKIVETTKELVEDKTAIEKEQQINNEPKIKTFEEVYKKPFKENTLKKVQIEQALEDNDKKADEAFAKLDKILEEKNIKLKKVEPSQEEKDLINKKIEKIKKDFEKIEKM